MLTSLPPLTRTTLSPATKVGLFILRCSHSRRASSQNLTTLDNRTSDRNTTSPNYSPLTGNMAEEQVTAALSAASSSGSPLTIFPLPRELRDKIYGYLLDGDYTLIKRTFKEEDRKSAARLNHTGPRAYHFHTNIMAVNRTIHEETEELLYKRNAFIVTSFQWPSLNTLRGGMFSVPVVSSKFVNRMQLHSTRIHISPGTNFL